MFKKIALLFLFLVYGVHVNANLMITPTRVVLDEKTRTAELTLVNSGTEVKTYRLSFVEQRQVENGSYVALSTITPEDRIASPMLRYSPRQVTIEPGKYQRIRVRANIPPGLETGEYLSHLKLAIIPQEGSKFAGNGSAEGLSINMTVNVSYSLPVILRKGLLNVETKISNLDYNADSNILRIKLDRLGSHSSFGGVVVEAQDYAGAPVSLIGRLNNVALFTSITHRYIEIKLDRQLVSGAVVRVRYNGEDEFKNKLLGEASFKYQP